MNEQAHDSPPPQGLKHGKEKKMNFLYGILVGIVVGTLLGIALVASGILHRGNCKVCKLLSPECKTDASSKP